MTVSIQMPQNTLLEQLIKSFYNLLPNDFNSFIKSLNCGIFICCASSDKATAGFGCTSAIIASAPIAIAAFAVGKRRSRRPVECVTSTTTGNVFLSLKSVQRKYQASYASLFHTCEYLVHIK